MTEIRFYTIIQRSWCEGVCNHTNNSYRDIAHFSTKEKAKNYLNAHKSELFYERNYGYEGSEAFIKEDKIILDNFEE